MKKILSLILCLTVSFTMMIPAFAANEEPPVTEYSFEEIKNMYVGEVHVPPAAETAKATQAEPATEEPQGTVQPGETPEAVLPEQETETESESESAPETTPEINVDELLESEEFAEILDEFGEEGEEIEDAIEGGEYNVIYITEEEFEHMRKDYALSAFSEAFNHLGEAALLLLLTPVSPLFIVVPFAGPFMLLTPIVAIPAAAFSVAYVVISPAIAIHRYNNYELMPGVEVIKESEN